MVRFIPVYVIETGGFFTKLKCIIIFPDRLMTGEIYTAFGTPLILPFCPPRL
jgi:hypothetical protein